MSAQAARNAVRSLQGEFSRRVHQLTERLIQLRIYVEAAIDFPEEEIDFLADGHVLAQLDAVKAELSRSEEHTYELQSLMRISYAVFCLKKKRNNTILQRLLI